MSLLSPRLSPLALALSLALGASASQAQTSTELELMRRLDQLSTELAKLKTELQTLQQKQAAAPAPAPAAAPATSSAAAEAATRGNGEPSTVISGYAEINYNRPSNSKDAQADLRRVVLGYQHRFDEKTKVVTEIEIEHGIASASDGGEVAIEQAYIEHQINPLFTLRGGLFLMPVGLLNENHEPPNYYGVERNFVETAIIPSTWREGGFQLVSNLGSGLSLQAGISTGFNLNKWDAASSEGRESPLGAIHQEMAQAKAHDLALFGAANWRGLPGLLLGASVFSGKATQRQTELESRISLWDVHARWTPGRWDLSAVYAKGTISNTAALNAPLVGGDNLIPASFDGWYAQAAYKLWEQGSYRLSPFARWEQVNTARSYADLGQGLTPAAAPTERIFTVGANFRLTDGVVFKADLQRFRENKDMDRFNLGVGWSF
ncbi:opacity protein-like surface antigen [Paucibacter oligotrophus]|uniref:Opacity protein-like surface antigen n=1 Tax=Roseateles oligotrophus TaxID=1769250 RepID=A0A840LDG2_9BURK|nr:hypothetical protein [Roseateles oligotrophus]MBB4844238.1 opacity protein-like surface antigen [Roseateles oligotrophus]